MTYITSLMPEISIIIPVYLNSETLNELYQRLSRVLKTHGLSYEIIFIDDASPDNSFSVIEQLAGDDHSVEALLMERNVGQHRAVLSGIKHARGKFVAILDADLQDSPEDIPDLLEKMRDGYAAVFAGRHGKYESFGRLLTSRIFKWLLHLICNVPSDAGIFLIMDRRTADSILGFNAPHPFIVAMIGCTGFPTTSIPVVRAKRKTGRSSYNSWKRLKTGCLALLWTLRWKFRPKHRSIKKHKEPAFKKHIGTFNPENAFDRGIGD